MPVRKSRLYLYIADGMIYYVLRSKTDKIRVCSCEALPDGTVVNGEIEKPHELYNTLKTIISSMKMRVGEIVLLVHEGNILIRKLIVNKEEMTAKTLKDHIKKQIGSTIHFPFDRPVYDIHIQKETDKNYEVVVFLTNEDLLQDYLDVFEKLWISDVVFDTSLVSLYRLYNHMHLNCKIGISEKEKLPDESICLDGLMLVALYNNNVSLIVYDGIYPVFSLIEDMEPEGNYCDIVANYIERISNYYSFNMNKGQKGIENIEIFNFTTGDIDEVINEKMRVCVERKNVRFFNFTEMPVKYSKDIPRGCYIPLAAGMER